MFSKESFFSVLESLGGVSLCKDSVEFFHEIDSTNTELLRRTKNSSSQDIRSMNKTLLVSESQSAGRGRIGRTYFSPQENGVYFSLLYAPENGIENPSELTVSASVAVCRAIEKTFSCFKKHALIKWVNDVLVAQKKVCGILTEGIMCGDSPKINAAVIGIGINVVMGDSLSEELLHRAGGILSCNERVLFEKETGLDSRLALCAGVVYELLRILERDEKIIGEYRARSMLTGKKVTVTPLVGELNGSYEATVLDVTDNASLLVRLSDGSTKSLSSGEVTLHE